ALQLHRVGFDRVTGFLDGGMLAWGTAGLPFSTVPVISAQKAHDLISAEKAVLLDVRSIEEWESGHAEGSVHVPWHDLRTRHAELDPSRQYITMCKGGPRGSIAVSILKMHGFARVQNLGGGSRAYQLAGFITDPKG
ncbi:MAG: rhodanese-like domain-containing protein, partial [Methanomicrobiales archaeon]|nr:rhodanese-like domain-containing protein [Methanomicrobiales archaeon]